MGLSVILHRAPPQVADRGTLSRYRGQCGNKIPRADLKITYDGLPGCNQDRGRSGNYKREAALVKLDIGGYEFYRYIYRPETDRRRWEPSCRMSHCDVEGKEKPPHYDLKAATKVL